ncbi:hypothetical protein A2U01_0073018, partial [Trifolium medium]|nr:hypothetical protein [Trifolium medium]
GYDFLGCYHAARGLMMHHASSSARVLGEIDASARVVQPISPFLHLGRPYPCGEGCDPAFCFAVETVESVPEQDVSGGCCLDEEEVSRTCGVSAGENEN